jgi:hypothetical protein
MYNMLTSIAHNIWSAQYPFVVSGVPSTSRMTVIKLSAENLWIHSPIPVSAALKEQLDSLGPVRYVIAPSLTHHLFVNDFAACYPDAELFGTPGLSDKRPDIANLQTLKIGATPWEPELTGMLFGGMPTVNETVWFHAPSATLILTDICQDWQGPLPWPTRAWATLSGVRSRFDVPLIVRMLTRDKEAARVSAQAILQWPFARVVVAHNAIVEQSAKEKLTHAFRRFYR